MCRDVGNTDNNDILNIIEYTILSHTQICHNGQCIGGQADALRECTKEHNIDFLHVNSTGTAYSNNLCLLKCSIGGNIVSTNQKNEGISCPTNSNGVRLLMNSKCSDTNTIFSWFD